MNEYRYLLRVLVLGQCGLGLLAGLGHLVVAGGDPRYLVVPVARVTLLLVATHRAVRGRRWGLIALIVLADLSLYGYALSLAAGVLPWFGDTVNLAGLASEVLLPGAVLGVAVRLLRVPPPAVLPRTLLAPPGWPAPPTGQWAAPPAAPAGMRWAVPAGMVTR